MGGKDNYTVRIQCDFMLGSNAGGCMVMVLGEFDNTTVNLTRENNDSSEAVTHHELAYSLLCYHQAYALDIEADGSFGSLSLPVTLVRENTTLPVECSPNEESPVQSEHKVYIAVYMITMLILFLYHNTLCREISTDNRNLGFYDSAAGYYNICSRGGYRYVSLIDLACYAHLT